MPDFEERARMHARGIRRDWNGNVETIMSDGSARKGDWMQTYTGRQFWPLDPHPDEIDIRDIAHALSMMCR